MENIKAANALLSSDTGGNLSQDIYINVIHNEFMTFEGTVDIPRLPVSEISNYLSYNIIGNLFPKIGKFLQNHIMLEQRNPGSEQHSIHLVRHLRGHVIPFCHIIRLDMKFSGDPSAVIERGNSHYYPSYHTDRIYYKSRLVPLDRWDENGTFIPRRIYDMAQADSDQYFHTYAIFDDINRGELTRKLCDAAGTDLFPVSLDLYPFLVFDYFTACMNVLLPTEKELNLALEMFEPLFIYVYSKFRDSSDIIHENESDLFINRLEIHDGAFVLTPSFRMELADYFGRKKLVRNDTLALKGWWKFTSPGDT